MAFLNCFSRSDTEADQSQGSCVSTHIVAYRAPAEKNMGSPLSTTSGTTPSAPNRSNGGWSPRESAAPAARSSPVLVKLPVGWTAR